MDFFLKMILGIQDENPKKKLSFIHTTPTQEEIPNVE